MLCIVISVPDKSKIEKASSLADILEFRLDLWPSWDFALVQAMMKATKLPVILTVRTLRQGGQFSGSKRKYEELLKNLARLHPAYLDIEFGARLFFLKSLDCPILLSYHNFQETPENLHELLEKMRKLKTALIKIATYARSS